MAENVDKEQDNAKVECRIGGNGRMERGKEKKSEANKGKKGVTT